MSADILHFTSSGYSAAAHAYPVQRDPERAYWLAEKEEAEAIFQTAYDTLRNAYRVSPLSFAIEGENGRRNLTDDEAARDHVERMVERFSDTVDPLQRERFNRFGWPEFKPEVRA